MATNERPKNIVLFSDGTGNSSGKLFKTNVWRLYQALDLSQDKDETQQISFYDDGVGTSSFKPLAFLGGAFGWGLKRNVIDLFTFLCWNYRPGDKIYCFGFSRGAFTIRVLVALIESRGLKRHVKKRKLRKLASRAFRTYRFEYQVEHYRRKCLFFFEKFGLEKWIQTPLNRLFGWIHCLGIQGRLHCESQVDTPSITFLGLWDTVAAYGLPIEELTRAWDAVFPLSTPDRNLSSIVLRACHALALDDERNSFHPVLWNESTEAYNHHTRHIHDERISQVWFAGSHSNVGGGYPDDGLAYVSLNWMMGEARHQGLVFQKRSWEVIQAAANPLGKIYDARHGLGGAYRYLPRKIEQLILNTDDRVHPVVVNRPKVHESVMKRIRSGVDGYAPFVLPAEYAVVMASGDIIDRPSPEQEGLLPVPIESIQAAEARASRQERVWNLVWWKRIAYFSSVLVAVALVIFPIYHEPTEACSGRFCYLAPIVNAVMTFLPGFTSPWLDAYKSHPGAFGLLALLLIMLMYIGSSLQEKMRDVMRDLWSPLKNGKGVSPEKKSNLHNAIFTIRTNQWYLVFFKLMKQRLLPLVAGVMALVVIAGGITQGLFAMWSSAGYICKDHRPTPYFTNRSLCWASGAPLEEGKTYVLTMVVDNIKEWKDSGILAGIEGLSREKMTPFMYAALHMRRHIWEPWFKPIARIGTQGTDEYPLSFTKHTNQESGKMEYVAEITARSTGNLFLFVNDAILPLPESWQIFYHNNKGKAKVTVRPFNEEGSQQIASSLNFANLEP